MSQKLAFADDHFHDECGVFGVFGHPEASNLAYLGLYALQHRGQESAGIVSSDGKELHVHRAMGEVEEIFQPSVLAQLPGSLAIGHTRYSRSEEHTSELQSLTNLVCRLLLEKKKTESMQERAT